MENIIQQYLLNELSAQEKADFQAEMKKNTDLRLAVQAARALMLARKLGNEMPTYEERQPLDKNSAEYHQAKSQLLKLVAKPMEEEIKRKRFFLSEIPKYYFSAASNFFIIDKNSEADIKAKVLGVVTDSTEEKTKKNLRPLWQNTKVWLAAASILLLVGLGIWWYSISSDDKEEWVKSAWEPTTIHKEARQVSTENELIEKTYNHAVYFYNLEEYTKAKDVLIENEAMLGASDNTYKFLLAMCYFHLPDSMSKARFYLRIIHSNEINEESARVNWHLSLACYHLKDKSCMQEYLHNLERMPDSLLARYSIKELKTKLDKLP